MTIPDYLHPSAPCIADHTKIKEGNPCILCGHKINIIHDELNYYLRKPSQINLPTPEYYNQKTSSTRSPKSDTPKSLTPNLPHPYNKRHVRTKTSSSISSSNTSHPPRPRNFSLIIIPSSEIFPSSTSKISKKNPFYKNPLAIITFLVITSLFIKIFYEQQLALKNLSREN